MKVCCKCKQSKPNSDFNKKSSNKDGLERYCRNCHRSMNRAHYESNSDAYKAQALQHRKKLGDWFLQLKSTLCCKICGETKPWRLAFHHRDPLTKVSEVSRMIGDTCSRKQILEEIAKCDVLCHNCHSDIHHCTDLPRQ